MVSWTSERPSTSTLLRTVRNEYTQDGCMVVVDDYDIVNRIADSSVSAPGGRGAANRAPAREPRLELTADEALLFRFSALTYNSHRIHYDHNWARQEGYADLVVHGPLQALMMGELVRRSACGLVGRTFHYRLVSPMIGAQTFTVATGEKVLHAGAEVHDAQGRVTAVSTVAPIQSDQLR